MLLAAKGTTYVQTVCEDSQKWKYFYHLVWNIFLYSLPKFISLGDIIVNRTLDGNERNIYLLEVSATDGGGRHSIDNAEVTVSIIGQGDPRPTFVSTRYLFTVPENSDQSYYIGTVEATNSNTGN